VIVQIRNALAIVFQTVSQDTFVVARSPTHSTALFGRLAKIGKTQPDRPDQRKMLTASSRNIVGATKIHAMVRPKARMRLASVRRLGRRPVDGEYVMLVFQARMQPEDECNSRPPADKTGWRSRY
jgi:hypothetical protein